MKEWNDQKSIQIVYNLSSYNLKFSTANTFSQRIYEKIKRSKNIVFNIYLIPNIT